MSGPARIYFIKPVGMDGPIKIGYSKKPEIRLLALSSWSPFTLEIIGTTPGGSQDENFLHRRFADLHTHREWFRSSPLLREVIARILAGEEIRKACVAIPIAGSIRNQKKRRPTPERQLFINYGAKIRAAVPRSGQKGCYYAHPSITEIMENWRGDYASRKPVEPGIEQIALLDAFLADPLKHSVFLEYGEPRDHRRLEIRLAEALARREAA